MRRSNGTKPPSRPPLPAARIPFSRRAPSPWCRAQFTPRYAAYYYEGPAAGGAAPEAAVAAATQVVLTGVLPSFGSPAQQSAAQALVEEAYRTALAGIPDGQPKQDGIAFGRAA